MNHAEELKDILQRFDDELIALGERVREDVVAPACRKHRLIFLSGNGTFYFCRRSKKTVFDHVEPTYGDRKDLEMSVPHGYRGLSESAKATLGPIIDLLNAEISHGQYLGYFVGDVAHSEPPPRT